MLRSNCHPGVQIDAFEDLAAVRICFLVGNDGDLRLPLVVRIDWLVVASARLAVLLAFTGWTCEESFDLVCRST